MDKRRKVELLEKNKPRQARAKRTYEAILAAAAELLVEVGVERISTNLIAERAGITVPALYRYFPNKYAVLHALGAVIMDVQNRTFRAWFERHMEAGGPAALMDALGELLWETYEVTRAETGGLEIIQALRAVAPLQEVRLASNRMVAGELAKLLARLLERSLDSTLEMQARTSVEMGYAVVEMALEDSTLDTRLVIDEGAFAIQSYWKGILRNR